MTAHGEKVWSFKTVSLEVSLYVEPDYGHVYDGEDEDGETQRKLNDGEYLAFDSTVVVVDRDTGIELGYDSLGASVYEANNIREFWTAHRDPNSANRNCAANSYHVCHYFPGMVAQAAKDARLTLAKLKTIRVRQ